MLNQILFGAFLCLTNVEVFTQTHCNSEAQKYTVLGMLSSAALGRVRVSPVCDHGHMASWPGAMALLLSPVVTSCCDPGSSRPHLLGCMGGTSSRTSLQPSWHALHGALWEAALGLSLGGSPSALVCLPSAV